MKKLIGTKHAETGTGINTLKTTDYHEAVYLRVVSMVTSAEPELTLVASRKTIPNLQSRGSWHIASYPRSGNHLVRAIIEAYTNQPTEGCLGAKRDIPICERPVNEPRLIQIYCDQPIGYKAHFVREIHERDKARAQNPMGMVFITRDPAAAISSHSTRMLSNRRKFPWLTKRQKRITIQAQIDLYLSLVFRYAVQKDGPKVHVKFEDLISTRSAEQAAKKLLSKLGARLEGPPLNEVYKIAKESQSSLSTSRQDLKNEIEDIVRGLLSYDDVLNYIQDARVD